MIIANRLEGSTDWVLIRGGGTPKPLAVLTNSEFKYIVRSFIWANPTEAAEMLMEVASSRTGREGEVTNG